MAHNAERGEQSLSLETSASAPAAPPVVDLPFVTDVQPWQLFEELPIETLDATPPYTRLQVQLLHNRGVSRTTAIQAFMASGWQAHGERLSGLETAIPRILDAIARQEHIVVFGDYDCDGITSCALLTIALRHIGAHATPYIPRRDDDGRGLNETALHELHESGATLLITTDCGSANVAETELARQLSMDVIVTDHHQILSPLAPAYAIINPQQLDDHSHNKDLAGVGVAFRLAEALLSASDLPQETRESSLSGLLDLVVVGTVADLVRLSQETWALAHAGLHQLNEHPRPGLAALIRNVGLKRGEITTRDISFALAPRLNAGGRLGQPMLAVQLLMTEDAREAEQFAAQLEALNAQRQHITEAITLEARAQVEEQFLQAAVSHAEGAESNGRPPALIVVGNHWPLGILGLVAGRLAEEYHLPAFVISRDATESRGSGRAPRGYDLGKTLAARQDFFKRFGGHAQAAGFTLLNDHLDVFLAFLREQLAAEGATLALQASDIARGGATHSAETIHVDCQLPLHRLVPEIYAALQALAPFGPGFAEPQFVCKRARIVRCWRSGTGGRNLRLVLRQGASERVAFWARQGEQCDAIRAAIPKLPALDIVYAIRAYRRAIDDALEIEPHIVALRPSS